MSDDKILKFPENQEVEVRLKSTEPFWKGVDKYQKERYGYEIDDITGKEKFYCSQTLHELIQVSKVQKLAAFKLMLKNENNKSVWLLSLDGKEWKNKYQFGNENIENNIRNDANESVNIDTPISTGGTNLSDEIQKLKNEMIPALESLKNLLLRTDVLEKRIAAKEGPKPVSERDIQF